MHENFPLHLVPDPSVATDLHLNATGIKHLLDTCFSNITFRPITHKLSPWIHVHRKALMVSLQCHWKGRKVGSFDAINRAYPIKSHCKQNRNEAPAWSLKQGAEAIDWLVWRHVWHAKLREYSWNIVRWGSLKVFCYVMFPEQSGNVANECTMTVISSNTASQQHVPVLSFITIQQH